MNPQLQGIENISGTYVFDLITSNKRLKINTFFWYMTKQEWRERFIANPNQVMTEAGLTDDEKSMILAEDWLGLVQHGVNFFVLEKYARVVKISNMQVYALMRGESLEDFLKTRQVPELK
ncbi:protocatechuate 3,4-dioxygenase [Acinetobacter baumannii]|uniref:protocatechuate 3,4-dioxygenase n=1 Tax=Acinetobacter calcoaceticus/baumannii complex TaxID=909768 RepID=UPI0013BA4B5D|nr:protocatechuate 3,4-dioxygenase [Acinetobacter baumannii]NDX18458.1 protocatechuate 3,4-dioxygenase [Acinetobacter baumannii]NDX37860.1 protocatechuate 3,4-dioxygenase [Acinetobacter baumannii]